MNIMQVITRAEVNSSELSGDNAGAWYAEFLHHAHFVGPLPREEHEVIERICAMGEAIEINSY